MENAAVRWPCAVRRRTAPGRRCRCRRSPRTSASLAAPAVPPAVAISPPAPSQRRRRPTRRTPTPAGAPSPPFDGTSRRSIGELLRTRDVGAQLPEIPAGQRWRKATGAERVVPLAIAQPGQPGGRPLEIGGHDAAVEQFRMPAVITEGHEAVADPGDEGLAFEPTRIVPGGPESSALAERRSQIADDIQLLGAAAGETNVVDRVVRALEIEAVECQEDDQQPLERPRSDERVSLPQPRATAVHR